MADPIPSNWTFQTFAEYAETHEVRNHSSRVVYDDTDEPVIEIPDPTP